MMFGIWFKVNEVGVKNVFLKFFSHIVNTKIGLWLSTIILVILKYRKYGC